MATTRRWMRRTPLIGVERHRVRHGAFQVVLQAGAGLSTGQGSDPQLMLRWSDDGGHQWSNEHWVTAGALGTYRTRAIWRRLGNSRGRIYEVSGSDPVLVALIEADVETGANA